MDEEGRRPLHCAAGHPAVARLLVRLGASTTLKDGRGRTALEAAAGGDAELERALLAEASQRRCAGCGKQEPRLRRCGKCRAAQYCRCAAGFHACNSTTLPASSPGLQAAIGLIAAS